MVKIVPDEDNEEIKRENPEGYEQAYAIMASLARNIDEFLQTHTKGDVGFTLFVFEFGQRASEVNYISNANKDDMIAAVSSWLAHATKNEVKQ